MRILLAADGSPFTRVAARHLVSHMHWFAHAPEIHIVHVHAPLPYPGAASAIAKGSLEKLHREDSEAALAVAEKELKDAGIPYRSAWKVGDAAERLAAYVNEHSIDLMVMGTRGHGALAGLALGSVVTKCIAALTIPVMIVRQAPAANLNANRVKQPDAVLR